MMAKEVVYKLELKHKIAITLSLLFFVLSGVLVIRASLSGSSRSTMFLTLFITSLIVLVAVAVIASRKSTEIRAVEVTPLRIVEVKPELVGAVLIRNRFFQAVALVYALSSVLMVASKTPGMFAVNLAVLPAFLAAITGKLSQKVVIAEEGVILGESLVRWDRISRIEVSKSAISLCNDAGVPVAVLPNSPDVERILKEQIGKQNV